MRFSSPPRSSVVLAASAQARPETEFLFDALHGKTPYHASWDRLMKLVQPTPGLARPVQQNFDGVAGTDHRA